MSTDLLTLEQRAALARALPLRQGFDVLSAEVSPDGHTLLVGVNDPLGPQRFAPGGFSQLARVRQQSFLAALDTRAGSVRFREFDGVLRRFYVASAERVVCELGYPFSQWVALWNPAKGKLVQSRLGDYGEDNLVVVQVSPDGTKALLGHYYRKEYNDTDPYLGLSVVDLSTGETLAERLEDGIAYLDHRKGLTRKEGAARFGKHGPELLGARFVEDGVEVVLARVDRIAPQRDLWDLALSRCSGEVPEKARAPAAKKVPHSGARLGKGLATGRWRQEKGSLHLEHRLRARKGESARALGVRAALSLVAGVELYFDDERTAFDFAMQSVRELGSALRYAHRLTGGSWLEMLAAGERFHQREVEGLLRHEALRTRYDRGWGALLLRSGLRHSAAWSRSVLLSGATVCLTEPASALDDPAAYVARLKARLGERPLSGGSAGLRLTGLPCFDPREQSAVARAARRLPGVDVSGSVAALNWLTVLPAPEGLGTAHALLERLTAALPKPLLEEKLPGLLREAEQVRAQPDPRVAYAALLRSIPASATLHTLAGGYLLQACPAPVRATRARRLEDLAPLKEVWRFLQRTPSFSEGQGRFALWQCADRYRRWFYTPEEAAAEQAEWQREAEAFQAKLQAQYAQPVQTQGNFDEEFGD